MKKITFCVVNDLNHDQRMHRICATLQEAGYEVSLIGRVLPMSKPIEEATYQQFRLKCYIHKGKLFYIEFNIRLFFHLLISKADIVVANDIDTILAVYFATFFRAKQRVFDAHELFSEVPELEGRPISKAIWRYVEKYFIPRFKYKYTVSKSIITFFKEVYNQHFELIRNMPFLGEEPMNRAVVQDVKVILYQGALNDGRGLEQMIEAMKGIHTYVLHIAGTGDIEQQLKAQVQELDVQDRVLFLGMLSPVQLKKETAIASIGINLLENKGLSYYYSLANKYFDYMHAAVPCISMNFPEYQDLNNSFETAVLIEELSTEAIVEAMVKLQDVSFYKQLQENCMKARQIYNWENEKSKLLQIYAQVGK